MKNNSRRICTATCILLVLAISLTGCGGNQSMSSGDPAAPGGTTTPSSSHTQISPTPDTTFSAMDAIKIEDIVWEVTGSIMDGERFVSFNYTNNSNYVIMDVEMTFRQKDGTTPELLSVFDGLKADYDWSDEDVADIYIVGYNRKCADPGETVTDSPCVINGTYILVETLDQYEIMEPDMVTIAFIGDDGKGYAVYYDFATQSYGQSSQGGQDMQQWSESEISSLLPKFEFKAVQVSTDKEDRFFFYAYGVSRDEYEAYVEAVKQNGFTEVGFDGNNSYRASNPDGIEANITYNAVEEMMTGCVEPE